MVYEAVAGTVQEFIDYALIAVTLMIIYFVFKLFTIDGPTKEDKKRAKEEQIDAARGWIKDKWNKYKENEANKAEAGKKQAERDKRARILGAATGMIINIESSCDNVQNVLRTQSNSSLHKAKDEIKQIEERLDSIKKMIRGARHGTKKEISHKLSDLSHYVDAIEDKLEKEVKDKMPENEKTTPADWTSKITEVRTGLNKIKTYCGHLMASITEFVEDEEFTLPATIS
jgi:archaellum component FlaC